LGINIEKSQRLNLDGTPRKSYDCTNRQKIRTEKLEVRISPKRKRVIQKAAKFFDMTVSELVLFTVKKFLDTVPFSYEQDFEGFEDVEKELAELRELNEQLQNNPTPHDIFEALHPKQF
jgi:hypothetical protein